MTRWHHQVADGKGSKTNEAGIKATQCKYVTRDASIVLYYVAIVVLEVTLT